MVNRPRRSASAIRCMPSITRTSEPRMIGCEASSCSMSGCVRRCIEPSGVRGCRTVVAVDLRDRRDLDRPTHKPAISGPPPPEALVLGCKQHPGGRKSLPQNLPGHRRVHDPTPTHSQPGRHSHIPAPNLSAGTSSSGPFATTLLKRLRLGPPSVAGLWVGNVGYDERFGTA